MLRGRAKKPPARGPGKEAKLKRDKALLTPVCGACYNPASPSPMYCVTIPGRGDWYRCTGRGPLRKGCGAPLIAVSELDTRIINAISSYRKPHENRKFIPDDDRADDIARLREQGAELFRQGKYAEAAAKGALAEELEAMPGVNPHWVTVKTDEAEGDYFASLAPGERHDYLQDRYEIIASRTGGELQITIIPRQITAVDGPATQLYGTCTSQNRTIRRCGRTANCGTPCFRQASSPTKSGRTSAG